MAGITLKVDSAPSTVAVGQKFTVTLSSNHLAKEAQCFHHNVNEQKGVVPMTGDSCVFGKNGVFTFEGLAFQQRPTGLEYPGGPMSPGPYAVPVNLKIKFTIAVIKNEQWDPLAFVEIPIALT